MFLAANNREIDMLRSYLPHSCVTRAGVRKEIAKANIEVDSLGFVEVVLCYVVMQTNNGGEGRITDKWFQEQGSLWERLTLCGADFRLSNFAL